MITGECTKAELRSHGIRSSAVGHERVLGKPLDVRCGDDRFVRCESGGVTQYFNWFSDSQIAYRKAMSSEFAKELHAAIGKSPRHSIFYGLK